MRAQNLSSARRISIMNTISLIYFVLYDCNDTASAIFLLRYPLELLHPVTVVWNAYLNQYLSNQETTSFNLAVYKTLVKRVEPTKRKRAENEAMLIETSV